MIDLYDWLQVLQHQVSAGAKGITAVMGPPVHSFPPLFRQNGPYSKYRQFRHHWWYIFPSDLCINRQARPAYRCNMNAKRPYCFKVNANEYKCRYGEHTLFRFPTNVTRATTPAPGSSTRPGTGWRSYTAWMTTPGRGQTETNREEGFDSHVLIIMYLL